MRPAKWLFLLRLATIVALAASAALYADYTSASPAFCSNGTGCAAVRHSGYGYVPIPALETYIPVPSFGLFGFGLLMALSLVPMLGSAIAISAGLGGIVALVLLYLQAVEIGEFCLFCVVVDVSGIIAAIAGFCFWWSLRKPDVGDSFDWLVQRFTWPWLGALAIFAPLVWGWVKPMPPVPPGVLEHYQPNKINVVEFADYECPFCRMLHVQLKRVIEHYPGKVNFVRLNMPLASHAHAKDAALSAACVKLLAPQKAEAIADVLFSAEDLTPPANRDAALKVGVDPAKYDACLASGDGARAVAAESKILRDAGFEGLPTTYVGARRIVGALPEADFHEAFQEAERGGGKIGIPGPVYLLLVALLTALIVWAGRQRPPREAKPQAA